MAKLHKLCYLSDLLSGATLAEPYGQIKMDFTFTLNLNLSKLICICVPKHFQSVTLYFPRVPQILLSVEFSFLLGSTGVIRGLNIFMSRSQEAPQSVSITSTTERLSLCCHVCACLCFCICSVSPYERICSVLQLWCTLGKLHAWICACHGTSTPVYLYQFKCLQVCVCLCFSPNRHMM